MLNFQGNSCETGKKGMKYNEKRMHGIQKTFVISDITHRKVSMYPAVPN